MKTLDQVVDEKSFPDVGLLKLDVQGSEVEVLKGGLVTLRKAQFALLEVSFLQYNKGAPLVNDVVSFMDDRDFVIYDIGTILRGSADGIPIQADLLFVKRNSELRPKFF